jgi:hypothetical protein
MVLLWYDYAMEHDPLQPASIWTRVDDDTGGGQSLTGFPLLYFNGDDELAARAIESAFDVERHAGTDMYGSALGFRQDSSFAAVSWYERGCVFDTPARAMIEKDCGQPWRPYVTQSAWRDKCERSVDAAIAHRRAWSSQRHGKMFYCARPETLALAITCPSLSGDDEHKCSWGAELVALERSGLLCETNQRHLGAALASILSEASLVSMARAQGDEEAPESWLALADRIQASDFHRARALCPRAEDLLEIDWAQLRFAAFPERRNTAWGSGAFDSLGAEDLARLRFLAQANDSGAIDYERSIMRPRLMAMLEHAEIALISGASAPSRSAPRI